jgi:hypothetical protein
MSTMFSAATTQITAPAIATSSPGSPKCVEIGSM